MLFGFEICGSDSSGNLETLEAMLVLVIMVSRGVTFPELAPRCGKSNKGDFRAAAGFDGAFVRANIPNAEAIPLVAVISLATCVTGFALKFWGQAPSYQDLLDDG